MLMIIMKGPSAVEKKYAFRYELKLEPLLPTFASEANLIKIYLHYHFAAYRKKNMPYIKNMGNVRKNFEAYSLYFNFSRHFRTPGEGQYKGINTPSIKRIKHASRRINLIMCIL